MLPSIRYWLTSPVIEDAGVDRPFRLRRVSLLLMAGGWLTFLLSCLIGMWYINHNIPVIGWPDLVRGTDAATFVAGDWAKIAAETLGGAMFFAGMFSVTFFDHRDRIPVWKAE